MKANFKKWFDVELRALEGGVANLKGDAGGYTVFGIARNFWPNWSGWALVDMILSKNPKISEDNLFEALRFELETFYKNNFWDVIKADDLPSGIDTYMMSAVVHNGVVKPSKMLQEAIGVTTDGRIGNFTISKAKEKCVTTTETSKLLLDIHNKLKHKYDIDNSIYKEAFFNRADKSYNFAKKLLVTG